MPATSLPFRRKLSQFDLGRTFTMPAPYGGINARDNIADLKEHEARSLINWFPMTGQLQVRPPDADFATGMTPSAVQTLVGFKGATAEALVAATSEKIYDVTTGTPVQKGTGFAVGFWQTANGIGKLFMANGTDAPQTYDGSTLSAGGWSGSGLTVANLINVAHIKTRVWFCEKNSADVWYGGVGSITGALTKFQLSQVASGGYCMAIGSWSQSAGGNAIDDLTVFVMSTGQIIIYSGDPASTFTMVSRFGNEESVPPIGRRCLVRVGGELLVITRSGLLPLSAALGGKPVEMESIDPWGKVAPLISTFATLGGSEQGWSGIVHQGALYINCPVTSGIANQLVMNTRNSAWSQYEGFNANQFAGFGNALYFGRKDAGAVALVDTAASSGSITTTARSAFVVPSRSYRTNMVTALRPLLLVRGGLTGVIGSDADYFESSIAGETVTLAQSVSTTPWGSPWGSPWGNPPVAAAKWFGAVAAGRAVAIKMRAFATNPDVRWFGTDVLFKNGGIR